MAPEINCPGSDKPCLIDPIELEKRLTSIEIKLDQLIAGNTTGLSGKSVAGLTTLISGLVVGIIEACRTFFSTTKG